MRHAFSDGQDGIKVDAGLMLALGFMELLHSKRYLVKTSAVTALVRIEVLN